MSEPIPRESQAHYDRGREAQRLFEGHGVIELARTQEIILRYLPAPPGTVLDVGGGSGVYACWLASLGYGVHLIDAIPLHVEQAQAASARQPHAPLAPAGWAMRAGSKMPMPVPTPSCSRARSII